MANPAMKGNLKLGNANHTTNKTAPATKKIFDKYVYVNRVVGKKHKDFLDLIILGADVTHTQRESALDMPFLAQRSQQSS